MRSKTVLILAVMMLSLFVAPVCAQMFGPPMSFSMTETALMEMVQALDRIDMTEKQSNNLQAMLIKHQKETIQIISTIRIAEVELKEILMDDKVNLANAKKKVKEIYDARSNLEIRKLDVMKKVRALLTADQDKELKMFGKRRAPRHLHTRP
jgi:Spy/CpxP family protein refolding chaperone